MNRTSKNAAALRCAFKQTCMVLRVTKDRELRAALEQAAQTLFGAELILRSTARREAR